MLPKKTKPLAFDEIFQSTKIFEEINLARFDLVAVRLIILSARRGSISAASKECFCSTTGASDRIRKLERLMGCKLLMRHRRGVIPTIAGEILIAKGERIFLEISALFNDLLIEERNRKI